MFNLSGSEIIVILLLALVVLGPEKLPEAMRRAGKTFAEIKKLSSGFQDEVRKGFEEPSREIKKTAATVKSAARFPTITGTSSDKLRHNPATDPPPEPPGGSSVAAPLDEPAAEPVEATATAEPADAVAAAEEGGTDALVAAADVVDMPDPPTEQTPVAEADHTA